MRTPMASTIIRESENSDGSMFFERKNSESEPVVGRFPLCTSAIAPSSGAEHRETESFKLGCGSS